MISLLLLPALWFCTTKYTCSSFASSAEGPCIELALRMACRWTQWSINTLPKNTIPIIHSGRQFVIILSDETRHFFLNILSFLYGWWSNTKLGRVYARLCENSCIELCSYLSHCVLCSFGALEHCNALVIGALEHWSIEQHRRIVAIICFHRALLPAYLSPYHNFFGNFNCIVVW